MEKEITGFLNSLLADGKSKCTLKSYASDLKGFSEFIGDTDVSEIKFVNLREWMNSLLKNGLSANTRSRKISSVKSFFNYLYDVELIDENPAEKMKKPKIEKKKPVVISNEEAINILDSAKNYDGMELIKFRDYAIISMFLYTGIRREELTNISLDDIRMEDKEILIHGKGSKQRIVYITDFLYPVIDDYINNYRNKMPKAADSNFLFPSIKTEKLSVNAVNNIVNKFFESSGIKKNGVSAHVLRKRFATSVFDATHDIATVSKLLGHSSTEVTERYIDIDESNNRKVAMSVNFKFLN